MSGRSRTLRGARPGREPRRVLVTNADRPIGRRVVETLVHDAAVASILAVGTGPVPIAFERLPDWQQRLRYQRADLTQHRSVAELFDQATMRAGGIDAVIHIPRHGVLESEEGRARGDAAGRSTEARLVQRSCLRNAQVRTLVALGSAFVYRLAPGNANRLTEESELDFDPGAPPEIRSWVDCDMMFRGEEPHGRLWVTLLRLPTVVTSMGEIFLHPTLSSIGHDAWLGSYRPGLRPMGYDPICALISDEDVARATQLALHSRHAGVYNVAGPEALPLSVLSGWTGRWDLPVPGPLLSAAFQTSRMIGGSWLRLASDGRHLRHGFTLETSKAERELGFRGGHHIRLARSGEGQVQTEALPL